MKTEHKVFIGVGLLTLLIIVGGSLLSSKKSTENLDRLSNSPLGEKVEEMSSPHVAKGQEHAPYNSNPPTSGPHYGNEVAGPGIKNEIIADEIIIHSLEHGAVVVWYKDDLIESDVDKIKSAFQSASGKKIMVPRKDLDVPVALTTWGYLLKLQEIDETIIKEFIEINNDRAPEKAPI